MLLFKALNIFYKRKPNLTASQKDDCPFWLLKTDPKQGKSCDYTVSEIELMRRIFSFCTVRFTYVALGCLSLLFWVFRLECDLTSPGGLVTTHLAESLVKSRAGPRNFYCQVARWETRTNSFIRHSKHNAVVHFTCSGPEKMVCF